MMDILVNGMRAVIKIGSSFEYIAENRLFSGADGYTLNISFPLKDCLENERIFGSMSLMSDDTPAKDMVFDCEIREKSFIKSGALVVTSISREEIKTQFLEGRSAQNFDKSFDSLYINECAVEAVPGGDDWTPVGNPDAVAVGHWAWHYERAGRFGRPAWVCLPWVLDSSGSMQNGTKIINYDTRQYGWSDETKTIGRLSRQFYLGYVIEGICKGVGYTIDMTEWYADPALAYLLVCNTLPAVWDIKSFARALPHWTVAEFFEKLELFLNCEFEIDHRAKTVTFVKSENVVSSLPEIEIKDIFDDGMTTEISIEDARCDYISYKRLKYASEDNQMWKLWRCPWVTRLWKPGDGESDSIGLPEVKIKRWRDISSMIFGLKSWEWSTYKDWMTNEAIDRIHWCEKEDMYFIIRGVDGYYALGIPKEDIPEDFDNIAPWIISSVLQPVNIFGEQYYDNADEPDYKEIDFVPVTIDWTDTDHGMMMFLSPTGYAEGAPDDPEEEGQFKFHRWDAVHRVPSGAAQTLISSAEIDNRPEYYSKIHMAWWDGRSSGFWWNDNTSTNMPAVAPYIYPTGVHNIFDGRYPHTYTHEFRQQKQVPFDFRIDNDRRKKMMAQVVPEKKYSIIFLSDTIPNPRSIFVIRGKRYLCEKITATFSETGLSRQMKGVFWPIDESISG